MGGSGRAPFLTTFGAGPHAGPVARQDAALLFADVSGYTRLSERLAVLGRAGAELVTQIVNRCFTLLISEIHRESGEVVRFGGDALFVAFVGHDRSERAARAAAGMQRAMRSLPVIDVPGGRVRLRVSMGLHEGSVVTCRWDGAWTEIVPVGDTVSRTLRLEAAASSGEVAVSPDVAAELGPGATRAGRLRLSAFDAPSGHARRRSRRPDASAWLLPASLADLIDSGAPNEHRALSIAFVELSGTDRLAEDGPACAAAFGTVFDAVAAACDRYGLLRIETDVYVDAVKIILVTGLPDATEDDQERLLHGVRSIVAADPTRVRAGAHVGSVFCGAVGHPRRRSYTMMGDAVNLAARLMGRAGPGQLVASRDLVDCVPGRFAVDWLEPFAVKGKRAMQSAGVVGSPRPHGDEQVGGVTFRGRREELRLLAAAAVEAGAVEVVGEPGAGATRLVTEAARAGRWATKVVVASVDDRESPLAVVRRAAAALAGPAARSASDRPGAGAPTGLDAIARLAGELVDEWPEGDTLVVERSHHLDDASSRVLRGAVSLLALDRRSRRLVVAGRAPLLGGAVPVVRLRPLRPTDVRAIVTESAAWDRSDAEIDAVVSAAGGNPRMAQRLARLDLGDDLPPSLESMVARRLDRLPLIVRRVVREAAVVGDELAIEDLAAIGRHDPETVRAQMGLARELLTVVDGQARFRDDLTRSVAAAGLPVARRRELHARTARRLEQTPDSPAAAIARHWAEAGDDARTVRWAVRAGDAAMAAGASTDAALLLDRALAAARRAGRPDREICGIADRLATAAHAAALLDLEARALAVAERHSRTAAERCRFLVRRAACALSTQRLRTASMLLARAKRLADERDLPLLADIETESAWVDGWSGRIDIALGRARRVTTWAREAEDPSREFAAWNVVEQILSSNGLPGGTEAARAALVAARATGDGRCIGIAEANLGLFADNRGRWPAALRHYARAQRALVRGGWIVNAANVNQNRASILVELGRLDQALEMLAEVGRVFAAAGDDHRTIVSRGLRARAAMRVDGTPGADAALRSAIAYAEALGDHEIAGFQRLGLVEVCLLAGDVTTAARVAQQVITESADLGESHLLPVIARRLAAVAEWRLGEHTAALALLEDAAARAAAGRVTPEIAAIAATAASFAVARGDRLAPDTVASIAEADARVGVASRPWFALTVGSTGSASRPAPGRTPAGSPARSR